MKLSVDSLQRDWTRLARSKAEHWRVWKRAHGAAGGIRIADELRRQVIAQRPGWPSSTERDEDLSVHLRVSEALRRARPPRSR